MIDHLLCWATPCCSTRVGQALSVMQASQTVSKLAGFASKAGALAAAVAFASAVGSSLSSSLCITGVPGTCRQGMQFGCTCPALVWHLRLQQHLDKCHDHEAVPWPMFMVQLQALLPRARAALVCPITQCRVQAAIVEDVCSQHCI